MTKKEKEIKIIFFGTPEFGAIVLDELIKENYKPYLVVTAEDKPVGRKQIITAPPVKIKAKQYKIPVIQPTRIKNEVAKIKLLEPELIVLAAYGQIIPEEILKAPKYGCLNIHPSLLPRHRGASPIQRAILEGDKETGATIMLMDQGLDTGPILAQKKTEIGDNETAGLLHDRLAKLGAQLLIDTIPDWIRGDIKLKPQDNEKATYAKLIKKEDGKINWKSSAEEIDRQIRAFNPWPGAYSFFEEKTKNGIKEKSIKMLEAGILKQTKTGPNKEPGKVYMGSNQKLAIQTGENYLIVRKLQLEGKKPITTEDFLRGNTDFIGTVLK